VLEVRAQLSAARGAEILSRKSFLIQKPAASPDARGGAGAARDAVHALADDIERWLAELSRDRPALPAAVAARKVNPMGNPYAIGLDKNPANYVPLTPLTFLERSSYIYPDRVATIHGNRRYTWRQVYERSRRLASALASAISAPAIRWR
jgi:hypothetical protein